jgi:hypothetical protein
MLARRGRISSDERQNGIRNSGGRQLARDVELSIIRGRIVLLSGRGRPSRGRSGAGLLGGRRCLLDGDYGRIIARLVVLDIRSNETQIRKPSIAPNDPP